MSILLVQAGTSGLASAAASAPGDRTCPRSGGTIRAGWRAADDNAVPADPAVAAGVAGPSPAGYPRRRRREQTGELPHRL